MSQKALITKLGEDLDNDVFPSVRTGGVLVPASRPSVDIAAGQENESAESTSRSRRSATGPWEGAAGWQGPTGRPPNPTPSSLGEQLRRSYETQLGAVKRAYPGARVWQRDDGMWLLVRSAVLPGLRKTATFLILLPYIGEIRPFGWGFWRSDGRHHWIGPRHTNFPEGSICAYTIEDGTWLPGGDILTLADLYTLWAFRHLHDELFDRWPGYHSAPHPYERILEFKDGEYCGCGSRGVKYADCCKVNDDKQDISALASDFRSKYGCDLNERSVPRSVLDALHQRAEPRTATSLLLEIGEMAATIKSRAA